MKLGTADTETVVMLEQVFGNAVQGQVKIFECHRLFREGQMIVLDDEWRERPSA